MPSDSVFKRDVAKIILDKGILAAILVIAGLWANKGLAQFQSNLNGRVEELKQQLALDRSRAELRTEVASAFFKMLAQSYPDPSKATLAEAEARIAVFGAPAVVKAYAAFKNDDMKMSTPDGQRDFLQLVGAIRKDFSGSGDSPSTQADISQIFFSR